MATIGRSTRSKAQLAASRLLDAEIDATVEGREPRFPNWTAFVPSDLATPESIRRHHAEGHPVVIVDEHGNERFLPVP